MKNKIVWGTCWYNESADTLIEFFKNSIKVLEELNFEVIPIVFDARYKHNFEDINLIKREIKNVIIILNNLNIYPNKNYGVALITNMAKEKGINYVAIVDPDWDVIERKQSISNMVFNLINMNFDILIPDIDSASGRSNLLIGRTVVKLFYPEYNDILKSPFPGAVAAKTEKLYDIVNSDDYHFDWGGEWDIVALAIDKNMHIGTSPISVVGVRHRTNTSKMNDSFQIWKAIFENPSIITRCKNINNFALINHNNKLYELIKDKSDIKEIIKIIENSNPTKTERQILYMILYPVALIMHKIAEIPPVDNSNEMPYNKDELYEVFEIGIYIMQQILKNIDIKDINKNAKTITGKYFSNWDFYSKKDALKESLVVE